MLASALSKHMYTSLLLNNDDENKDNTATVRSRAGREAIVLNRHTVNRTGQDREKEREGERKQIYLLYQPTYLPTGTKHQLSATYNLKPTTLMEEYRQKSFVRRMARKTGGRSKDT